jgi:hypothetical protein
MYSDVMIIKIEFLPDLIEAVVLPCSSIGRLVLSVCDSTSGRPPPCRTSLLAGFKFKKRENRNGIDIDEVPILCRSYVCAAGSKNVGSDKKVDKLGNPVIQFQGHLRVPDICPESRYLINLDNSVLSTGKSVLVVLARVFPESCQSSALK